MAQLVIPLKHRYRGARSFRSEVQNRSARATCRRSDLRDQKRWTAERGARKAFLG